MQKILLFIILLCSFQSVEAYISLHPKVVLIDKMNRSGTLIVWNQSDTPKEVTIELKFGFPDYDSTGKGFTNFPSDSRNNQYSAVPFVKIFPKKLIIPGKGKQIVRFLATKLGKLDEGLYWARIIVNAQDTRKQISSPSDTTKIKIGMKYKIGIISALIVKKGKTDAAIVANGSGIRLDSNNLNVMVDIDRSGNSPFWGRVKLDIFDSENNIVAEKKENLTLYFSAKKAFTFDVNDFKTGKYRAEMSFTGDHPGMPEKFRPQFKEYQKSFFFDVNKEE